MSPFGTFQTKTEPSGSFRFCPVSWRSWRLSPLASKDRTMKETSVIHASFWLKRSAGTVTRWFLAPNLLRLCVPICGMLRSNQ